MPLTIGILAAGPYLNSISSKRAAAAVPVNPETDIAVVKIKLEILCVLDRVERERILSSFGASATFLPKIKSEIAGTEVPIVAVRYRDTVVCSVEGEGLADFAWRERCIIHSSVVIVLTVGRVAF